MARNDRWYFTKEQLFESPSRRCGIDGEKELSYRQQAANFIQDMGQRLQVTQLCINTAIVYMHRFYIFHSFSKFHRNAIAACAIFLAAKVEEQPRKLEHVIKVAHFCLNTKPNRNHAGLETRSPEFIRQANELVVNENIMLQTLGFDIAIEHPHTSVVKCCQLVRASKDLAQTSYFMATNSLHLTTMCLQYRPTVVACVCIHLACKWASWEIPVSNEGKDWFYYVDSSVTLETLESLTDEFLAILDRCPSRLRRRVLSSGGQAPPKENSSIRQNFTNLPEDNKRQSEVNKHGVSSSSSTRHHDPNHPLKAIPRKDVPIPPTSNNNSTTSHPNQFEKKDGHAAYGSFKNKKESDRKPSSSHSSASSHVKSSSMQSSGAQSSLTDGYEHHRHQPRDSKPLNHHNHHPLHGHSSSSSESHLKSGSSSSATSKQQQIAMEKQRQIEERSKIRDRSNNEGLWSENRSSSNVPTTSLATNFSATTSTTTTTITSNNNNNNALPSSQSMITNNNGNHQKIQNQSGSGYANQAFYDNLINEHAGSIYTNSNSNSSGEMKHFKANSVQSNDNDDSLDLIKREPHNDLKMEFSDNESNQSPTMNLSSISSLMMPMNGYSAQTRATDNGAANVSPVIKTTVNKPVKSSFMSIFTKEEPPLKQANNQFPVKKEPSSSATSFELKNHFPNLDFNTYNKVIDYQLTQPSTMLSPLTMDDTLVKKQSKPYLETLNQSNKVLNNRKPNLLPTLDALDLPPLPMNFAESNISSQPSLTTGAFSSHFSGNVCQTTSATSLSSFPMSGLDNSNTSIVNTVTVPAIQPIAVAAQPPLPSLPPPPPSSLLPLPMVPAAQSELAMLLESNSKPTSSSKSKDKERHHDKPHKHHKEKKHKHKSKDKHKDKHKEKNLTVLAVEKSDDMMNNNSNTPIRMKFSLKKPTADEMLAGDEPNKGLKLRIAKTTISTSGSSDRKRHGSPKESRSSKSARLDIV